MKSPVPSLFSGLPVRGSAAWPQSDQSAVLVDVIGRFSVASRHAALQQVSSAVTCHIKVLGPGRATKVLLSKGLEPVMQAPLKHTNDKQFICLIHRILGIQRKDI